MREKAVASASSDDGDWEYSSDDGDWHNSEQTHWMRLQHKKKLQKQLNKIMVADEGNYFKNGWINDQCINK